MQADDCEELVVYETGSSARPTPTPIAFKLAYSKKTEVERGQGTQSELATHGNRYQIVHTQLSQSPQSRHKDGECLMILATKNPSFAGETENQRLTGEIHDGPQ